MQTVLKPSDVFVDVAATTREEAIAFLSEQATAAGLATSVAACEQAFMAREALAATGMEDGFAIPHAKDASIVRPGLLLAKLAAPVEWPSYGEEQQVDVAFGIVVPTSEVAGEYLELLSQVAVALMDASFRTQVKELKDPAALAELVNQTLANLV
jgi:PTS system fructose-specific IIA component